MKLIYDLADRYQKLAALEIDPKVINSDGTPVNAYLELAAECFEVKRTEVTVDMRDHMIRITRKALEKAIFHDSFKATFGSPPWNKG